MKKLLLVAVLFLGTSCTHENQKINLTLRLDDTKSNIGNGAKLDLMVFDERANDSILGTKEFSSDEKIKIISQENVALLLTQKVEQNLIAKGFKKGNDKVVEIHLEQLHYLAKRGFPVGTSEGIAVVKVVVKNTKNKSVVTKNFSLSLNNKHFIAPLESTDSSTINGMLQEITHDILSNPDLLKTLAQ